MLIEFNEHGNGGELPSKYSLDFLTGINILSTLFMSKGAGRPIHWSNDGARKLDVDEFDPITFWIPPEYAIIHVHQYSPDVSGGYDHLTSYGYGEPIAHNKALEIIKKEADTERDLIDKSRSRYSDDLILSTFPPDNDYFVTPSGELFFRFPYMSYVLSHDVDAGRVIHWQKGKDSHFDIRLHLKHF